MASAPSPAAPGLNLCLGPLALTAQAVATVGLTLTAVINLPEAVRSAGHATWVCYAIPLVAIVLEAETLVLFGRQPGSASGIAGYGEAGLGPAAGAVEAWALLLGYGASMLACLVFLGFSFNHLIAMLGGYRLPLFG